MTFFVFFLGLKEMFLWETGVETQCIEDLEVSAKRGFRIAKKELARRLIDGKEVKKNDAKAASLLKECVIDGDDEAMLMLAKCYAFGIGVSQNGMQAEALVSESAKMGNKEALFLMELINDWKGKKTIILDGSLRSFVLKERSPNIYVYTSRAHLSI